MCAGTRLVLRVCFANLYAVISASHAGRRIKFPQGESLDRWIFSAEPSVLGILSNNVQRNSTIS